MSEKVIINREEEEIRVALLENEKLVELHIERLQERNIVGNIYKARVVNVVSGLQAVFVDIGLEKNAFLHFSDIPGELLEKMSRKKKGIFRRLLSHRKSADKKASQDNKEVSIEEILKPGVELLVQVKKSAIGTKPPRVTANIALPGRYLVMLPFNRFGGGVSRKIRDTGERIRLKEIIKVPRRNLAGFIVRTAASQHNADEIFHDVAILRKRWASIWRRARSKSAPALLYNEQDVINRLVRDVFSDKINEIIVDSSAEYKRLRRLLRLYLPSLVERVVLDRSPLNIFEKYNVEKQIEQALRRTVRLRSGGYLIIDELSTMTVIDVNSGGFVGKKSPRETILTTNLEAAESIARQLRLRDIGGLIVIDFIDMEESADREKVWQRFTQLMKQDRATSFVAKFAEFGLLSLTRKRTGQSLKKLIFEDCPYCKGSGQVLGKSELWRKIKYEIIDHLEAHAKNSVIIEVVLNTELYNYIEQKFSATLKRLAKQYKSRITLHPDEHRHIENFEIKTILPRGRKK
ncbi:Rne/Rng family ribonuclease [Candidatus Sumerlaeota bacterium]|nr:Rne/Rng family ribonuclease [Candidatus Sumerlaeota bacterium]